MVAWYRGLNASMRAALVGGVFMLVAAAMTVVGGIVAPARVALRVVPTETPMPRRVVIEEMDGSGEMGTDSYAFPRTQRFENLLVYEGGLARLRDRLWEDGMGKWFASGEAEFELSDGSAGALSFASGRFNVVVMTPVSAVITSAGLHVVYRVGKPDLKDILVYTFVGGGGGGGGVVDSIVTKPVVVDGSVSDVDLSADDPQFPYHLDPGGAVRVVSMFDLASSGQYEVRFYVNAIDGDGHRYVVETEPHSANVLILSQEDYDSVPRGVNVAGHFEVIGGSSPSH